MKTFIYVFFLIVPIIGFCQKNRYEKEFSEIQTLVDSDVKISKLLFLDSLNQFNTTEKFLFYDLIIPEAKNMQKYDLMLKNAFDGYNLALKLKNDSLLGVFLLHIGTTYYHINDKETAKEYYKKALKYIKLSRNWYYEAMTLNNIGAIYIEEKEFGEAEKALKGSISIFKKHQVLDKKSLLPQRLLATYYTETKNYKEAKKLYLDIIPKAYELNDTTLICFSLVYYSTLLLKENNLIEAKKICEEALRIQRIQNNKNTTVVILTNLAFIYSALDNYKDAALLHREVVLTNKEIFKENLKSAIAETEVKYKTSEILRKKEIAESKARVEKEKNKLYIIGFFAALFFLLIVFLLVFNSQQNKRKKNELLLQKNYVQDIIKAQEYEKTRIARDLHDGICQKFAATKMSFSSIDTSVFSTFPEIKNSFQSSISLLDEATNELRTIAHEIMPPALQELGLLESLKHLTNQTFNHNFIYTFENFGDYVSLGANVEINIYRITQELFANILKHSACTKMSVQTLITANQFSLYIEDNGKGMNLIENLGMGLKNIKLRAEIINAKFNLTNSPNGGTFASLIIDLKKNG